MSTRDRASSRPSGIRCPYRSNVMVTLAWPIASQIAFGLTPAAINVEAKVCRASCSPRSFRLAGLGFALGDRRFVVGFRLVDLLDVGEVGRVLRSPLGARARLLG